MLRFSQQLPIAKFFAYSSALIAVLAVVLAGKGVAALQEAGPDRRRLRSTASRAVPMLGLFPTLRDDRSRRSRSLAILLLGFAFNRRRSRRRLAPPNRPGVARKRWSYSAAEPEGE